MKTPLQNLLLTVAAAISFGAQAQNTVRPSCGTDAAMEAHFNAQPEARQKFLETQKEFLSKHVVSSAAKPAAFEYTVPVVFHVLHQGGPENVSDAACIAALKQVNDDFARLCQDTASIFAPFKNLFVNSEIKFMLAKKDPQGNCINGIVRHIDPKTEWSQLQGQQTAYWPYTWDPTRYLNIYIVKDIAASGAIAGGQVGGYTYVPGTWPTGNAHDAIVLRYTLLGANFPNPDARTLTHEIGHWIGLSHTFGNTNNPTVCGDDGITDTPPTKGNFNACPAASTNTNHTCSSPNPTNSANYFQNAQNIMDYSNCARNFTQGQTTVMRNVLASTVSGRNNLWSPGNITFTDVNATIPCAPIAEFLSLNSSYTVCAGGSLTMKDFSSNAVITNYMWAADNNATITAPSATQTNIFFPTIGVSNVTLTVSNAQGIDTQVRSVYVLDNTPGITGPQFESFESPGLPPFWSILDVENDGFTWTQTPFAAYDGSYSYYIEGAQQWPSRSDHLQMPIMDVKNNAGNIFAFAYAYARKSTTSTDVLRVQGSRDCGGTWNDIVVLNAQTMANGSGGDDPSPFLPNSSQWKIYTISDHPNWFSYSNSSNVIVRFNFVEGTDGFGNNIYVDAINYFNPTGVNEFTQKIGFSVYPNPTTDEANVHFVLSSASIIEIKVLDLLGKDVLTVRNENMDAGEHTVSFNQNGQLPKGIYFVNLSLNGMMHTSKLIIK